MFSLERRKMSGDRKSRRQADVWCVAGALEGRPAIEERDQWRARPTGRRVLETHMCWRSNSWLLPIKRFGATTPCYFMDEQGAGRQSYLYRSFGHDSGCAASGCLTRLSKKESPCKLASRCGKYSSGGFLGRKPKRSAHRAIGRFCVRRQGHYCRVCCLRLLWRQAGAPTARNCKRIAGTEGIRRRTRNGASRPSLSLRHRFWSGFCLLCGEPHDCFS